MSWEEMLREKAQGVVVDKGVSVRYDSMKLPRFVSEYLLSEFMLSGAGDGSPQQRMNDFVAMHIPQPGHGSEWQYRLKTGESCSIIDNISVSVQLERTDTEPQAQIPSINLQRARVRREILDKHPRLLQAGLWGKALLRSTDDEVWVEEFRPFQVSDVSLQDYAALRGQFGTKDWTGILISTMGLNPYAPRTRREELILLSRLLPLVQGQTFLVEMGPPGTGKTFVLDKLSTHSFVISGARISPAALFFDLRSRKEGLLRNFSAVLLDEVDKVRDSDLGDEVVSKLLKYMESGSFDRGGREFSSEASLVLAGNTPPGRQGHGPVLRNLPKSLTHEAFLDRLNGLVPGWELAPVGMSGQSLTHSWGFAADYFAEVLHTLRHQDWTPFLKERLRFGQCTMRDEKAVLRTLSGFTKLLYPDREVSQEELSEMLEFAVLMRQNILDETSLLHQTRPRHIEATVA